MKSLLMEAYYKGQEELLFVVPFIAKILSSCCKSTVMRSSFIISYYFIICMYIISVCTFNRFLVRIVPGSVLFYA